MLATIVILISLAWHFRTIKNNWMYAKGYEQEWVAGSLVGGYGFSFDPATAWLGPFKQENTYTPTAWVEPLYTFTIASSFKVFGEYGRLFLVVLNVIWLCGSSVMIFFLVREIASPHTGLYTALLFLLVHTHRYEVILYIGNTALAGFLYCVIVCLLIRCLGNPTLLKSALLGVVIGLANLNHAGSLLFAPLSALVILLSSGASKEKAWRSSFVLVLTTLFILSPWVLRNYFTFGAFVPVRSGFGYQLFIGNPGLAQTFTSGMDFDVGTTRPPWVANSPLHALRLLRDLEHDSTLASHSIDYVSRITSPAYQDFNEIERDRVFLVRSLSFIWAEPLLAARMLFWKTVVFFSFWDVKLGLISLAALLGGVLMIKDARVLSIFMLMLGYVFPYIISLPLYYRYRSPLEPMLFILAGCFAGACFQMLSPYWSFFRNRFNLLNK